MNDGYLSLGSGIWNFRVVVARNVPFDFQFFEDKEALQLASYQIAEDNESLREYLGLDGSRLILLVQHTKGILTSSGTKATPESSPRPCCAPPPGRSVGHLRTKSADTEVVAYFCVANLSTHKACARFHYSLFVD